MTYETERSPRRRRGGGSGIVWPLILIAGGLLFLLDNLGTIDVDWFSLWRLWPVLLVLIGLDLLLGGRSAAGNLIVAVLGLVIVGGVVFLIVGGGVDDLVAGGDRQTIAIEEPLGDAERAELNVQMAAGDLLIDTVADSDLILDGVLEVDREQPVWDVERDGATVRMTLDQIGGDSGPFNLDAGDDWQLSLSTRAGYDLTVELGAGQAELDLTGLDLRALLVDAGAARTEITFPATGGYTARISGGVGGVELAIPDSVAVRLQVDRGLTTLDLPGRYRQQGDVYVTEGWDSADGRIEVYVDMGVGLLTVRDN